VTTGSGFSSGQPAPCHFGLGGREACDVEVRFPPAGTAVRLEEVRGRQVLRVREEGAVPARGAGESTSLDASGPEYDPPDAPSWAREDLPDWVLPHVGKSGLDAAYRSRPGPLGRSVRGIDRLQANRFIAYRPETARHLYGEYTALQVGYRKGTLPLFESVSERYTAGCRSDTEKAVALLRRAMPASCRHPTMPPCGPHVPADRNLDDEALLRSGAGWCNEQARVYCRLCQVSGIPARIVFLFHSDRRTGHTVAEFHADGRWAMADASWCCVFPGKDGRLLSAAECHDGGEGQRACGLAYHRRFLEIAALPDGGLGVPDPGKTRRELTGPTAEALAARMGMFGIINYPIPSKSRSPRASRPGRSGATGPCRRRSRSPRPAGCAR